MNAKIEIVCSPERLARIAGVFYLLVGITGGLAVTALATGWWVAPLAATSLAAALGTGRLARGKIGGISGDVLGAAEQVAECLCMVVLSGLATHHRLWWA